MFIKANGVLISEKLLINIHIGTRILMYFIEFLQINNF